MSKVAFVFLHLGKQHPPSKRIIDILEESQIDGIVPIYAGSRNIKQWLTHNSQGIVVDKFPCFLVAGEGRKTRVYPGNKVKLIINMIQELLTSSASSPSNNDRDQGIS